MSRITVTEREHWQKRISRKIDKAIAALWDQDFKLGSKLRAKARKVVEERFGRQAFEEHENLLKAQEAIVAQVNDSARSLLKILGHEDVSKLGNYRLLGNLAEWIQKAVDREYRTALKEVPIGRQIIDLEREKEELHDTVWLATSSLQVKELWKRFSSVLEDQPTRMQLEAIEIPLEQDEE